MPEPIHEYCKLNKEWDDFKECKKESDCGGGYQCISKELGDVNLKDFRCVPLANYQFSCFCSPDNKCVCS